MGMNGSNFKNETLFVSFRLSLPPEMGEMAQTFMSEIEWLAALKCRATGLLTSLFLRNEGVQQICQIDVGPFDRCKVFNI